MSTPLRRCCALTAATALTLGLAACGSDSLDSGSGDSSSGGAGSSSEKVSASKDDALASQVPEALRKKGTLTVGTDASYPPNEYLGSDGKTPEGMDIDLLNNALTRLGLKATYQNAGFDGLILGIKGGKYDMGISSFTINKDRMQQVSFTSYFNAGTQWVTAKGNPKKINPDSPCGTSMSVQKGTIQVTDLQARSKKCTAAGKKAIKLLIEDGQTKATLDLTSGRVDAMAADLPVSVDAVNKSKGKLSLLGKNYDSAPYGVAYPKSQDAFGKALAKAFTAMKEDGSYGKILKKWGTTAGAAKTFEVNPSVSG